MVGCLFFPVVWASEPARSGDETTCFLTQKQSHSTPQLLTDTNIRQKRTLTIAWLPFSTGALAGGERGGGDEGADRA